jgi:hypothetical protein
MGGVLDGLVLEYHGRSGPFSYYLGGEEAG